MPLLERPGTFVSYRTAGAGPALLLTHGFSASAQMFAGDLPALSRRHQVVTWDIRGHGASGDPADPACYSAQASLDDMTAILDELSIERAVIGGHSLGGYLSLAFALAHPDRVSGLLLIGTGPGFRSDAPRAQWNDSAARQAARLERDGLAALGGGPEVRAAGHRTAAGLARAARGILSQHDSRVIDGLSGITVPALIIVGADDTRFLAPAEYMAGKMPAARLVVIRAAGHAPNIAQPEEFAAHACSFLDEVTQQPDQLTKQQ
ncbi:MAG TPA: alpha/beta fold hydrolase [Streptosporangiaceae bacterium]|jgi:pimeloyl-ACP methyl ester carboxylesterase